MPSSVGIDLIEIERIRRAIGRYPSFTARCFTEAERAYCDSRPNPAQHYAARFAGKEAVGKALGFGVARAFAWREVEIVGRPKPSVQLTGRLEERASRLGVAGVDLSMTHSRELAAAIAIASPHDLMFEPLYTAEEMREAEAGHDVRVLMERAGRAVAEEAVRRFPDARSFGAVCGGGANGGDARIALEVLRAMGHEAAEGLEGEVLLDGLFGTGFHGEPRSEAAEVIAQLNAAEAPVLAIDLPSGVDADTGEVAGGAVQAARDRALHGPKVGNVVGPGTVPRRASSSSATSGSSRGRPRTCSLRGRSSAEVPPKAARRHEVQRRPCSSWAARPGSPGRRASLPRPRFAPTRATWQWRRRPSRCRCSRPACSRP